MIWEQYALPKALKRFDCDVLHCTGNTAPLFTNIPIILSLHDVIFMETNFCSILSSPSSNYQKIGNLYRRFVVPFIVRKCQQMVTVSNYEKSKIQNQFPSVNSSKISVIYNGVSRYFKPVTLDSTIDQFIERYKLPQDFFFFIGGKDSRKNTINVLRAFSIYCKNNDNTTKLVILHHTQSEVSKLLKQLKIEKLTARINCIGYVSNTDLSKFYSLSSLFLFPSIREGFGIPVIEAMACKTPVLTSLISALPEVVQDAAYLVNPEQPNEIADAMYLIQNNSDLKNELIAKGYSRSQKFSWAEAAQQTLSLYLYVIQSIKK